MPDISEEVRKFIDRYVASVERLEVLLLLQRKPDREWTAGTVAAELRVPIAAADAHLAKLCSYSLLDVRIGNDLYYRFDPRPPHLEQAARALAAAYRDERLAVIKRILERPPEPIRDFADAFLLTKKDPGDG